MIALLQRVSSASVSVCGERIARIELGWLALLGVTKTDVDSDAHKLVDRVLNYRAFADADGRMNRSLVDVGGQLLAVPQFTLAAQTRKGRRPGFDGAASPERAQALFNLFVAAACDQVGADRVATGRFGAHMQVALVNDGPVTFWLQT